MRAAVVEDDENYRYLIRDYLERYGKENDLDIRIGLYTDGTELVNAYSCDWDLILMDVDMPKLDGISAARMIREKDKEVQIIFITNLAQYAIKGYEVDALDYVLKPVEYYPLALKLGKAVRIIRRNEDRFLLLNREGDVLKLPLKRLYYIEVFSHQLCYHTMDGDIVMTGNKSLTSVEKELEGAGFVRCHNAYLVNLRYVDGVEGNEVLAAGKRLPVSRNRRKGLMQALLEYARGGKGNE